MTLSLQKQTVLLSEWLAHGLLATAMLWGGLVSLRLGNPSWVAMLALGATFVALGIYLTHLERRPARVRVRASFRSLMLALIGGIVSAGVAQWFVGQGDFASPSRLMAAFVLGAVAISVSSFIPGLGIAKLLRPFPSGSGILIVGNNSRSRHLIEQWEARATGPMERVGYLDSLEGIDPSRRNPAQDHWPFLGELSSIQAILQSRVVDEVWITLPIRSRYAEIEQVINTCQTLGIAVRLPADKFNQLPAEASNGTPLNEIYYQSVTGSWWQFSTKRCIDIVASSLMLLLLAPVMLTAALIVKLTSKGPVLFTQERCGLRGRRFTMYKFRSMVVDAEAMKKSLLEQNEASGPVFKMRDDPRITRIGAFLRRTSLDELPQLFNVLRGEMSLVGPRPPVPDEVAEYAPWQRRRLSVKPGLTCTWQVSGRSLIQFEEWMQMDLEYINGWSLRRDFSLLFRTVPAVLTRSGAA
jgi:exopolysaccharide biosynthesis polyprenyl glycosylphosphotransferase